MNSAETRTLVNDGDALERATWAVVRDWFPHYEEFWQIHLLPLRAPGSIQPRRGIDEDFEYLAMFHYSTYVNLQRAIEKSESVDGSFRFPDEIYLRQYGAAELGFKVVEQFEKIYEACLKEKSNINSSPLRDLKERFADYRNLVHEQLPAVRLDDNENLHMVRRDKIGEYGKWTTVLYEARPEDFVPVKVQVNNDLRALCSALEDVWKHMCKLSKRLVANNEYQRRRASGYHTVSLVTALGTTSQIYSATSSVIFSSNTLKR